MARFRRRRYASVGRQLSCRELWVCTDTTDTIAAKFYTGLGFKILGPAIESAQGQTTDDSDIVLKRML